VPETTLALFLFREEGTSGKLVGQASALKIPRREKSILICFCEHADDWGRHIWPSVRRIMQRTGYSERSVRYARRNLENWGIISALGNALGGRGKSTEYEVIVENFSNIDQQRGQRLPLKGAKVAPFKAEKGAKVAPEPPYIQEPPLNPEAFAEIAQAIRSIAPSKKIPNSKSTDKDINSERNRQRDAFERAFGIRL
jgi:hypothetical protein